MLVQWVVGRACRVIESSHCDQVSAGEIQKQEYGSEWDGLVWLIKILFFLNTIILLVEIYQLEYLIGFRSYPKFRG